VLLRPALADIALEFPINIGPAHRPSWETQHAIDEARKNVFAVRRDGGTLIVSVAKAGSTLTVILRNARMRKVTT
jgi:ribosomal protein S5